MDGKIANKLVSELRRHGGLIIPDEKLFLELLTSTDVPESSRFYEKLPDREQLSEGTGYYHYLSLRKVLRNRNAGRYKLPQWKKAYETMMSTFGVYSSDILSRNLRANDKLMKIMMECGEPFSLLGKFKTYEFNNPREELFIINRPVLVIPGVRDMTQIDNWEKRNTTYKKETRVIGLFPIERKISQQKYLSY